MCDKFHTVLNFVRNCIIIKKYPQNSLFLFSAVKKGQVKEALKLVMGWLWSILIQIEVISLPKQPSCDKRMQPTKSQGEKIREINGGGQEMTVMVCRLMAKILIR